MTSNALYLLVFKQEVPVAIANEIRACQEEELGKDPAQDIEKEVGIWHKIFCKIKERHNRYDAKIEREYLWR